MRKLIATLLFLVLLTGAAAQSYTERFVGILEPGGTLTTLDGITITARENALLAPQTIYFERINESELPTSLSKGLTAVTPFYRFRGPGTYRARDANAFLFRVPLPKGAPTSGLAVFTLAAPGDYTDGGDYPWYAWFSSPATYVSGTHQVLHSASVIRPKGIIFAIVEGAYAPEENDADGTSSTQEATKRFTGTLSPGETLTTIDGISITAREGVLDGPKEIYMERVDLSELPILLGEGLSAVTSFYCFGGSVTYRGPNANAFLFRIPLPEGAPTSGLAVFSLAMPKDILDGGIDPAPTWFSAPATYVSSSHQALTGKSLIRPEGIVFAVVEGRYKPDKK